MTALTGRIGQAADKLQLGRALGTGAATALSLPFYGLGWLAGLAVRGARWLAAAIVVGYQDGAKG